MFKIPSVQVAFKGYPDRSHKFHEEEKTSRLFSSKNENVVQQASKSPKKSNSKYLKNKASRQQWNENDAERALKTETEFLQNAGTTLIVKFPDPSISLNIFKPFRPQIEKIRFEAPVKPRYCLVQLSKGSNVDFIIREINKIDFFNLGKLKAEKKIDRPNSLGEIVTKEMIDPYSQVFLYGLEVRNISQTVTVKELKEKFSTASRIEVGYSPKPKYTRYAIIRYLNVEESIRAFKRNYNAVLDDRTLIVRFRKMPTVRTTNIPKDDEQLEECNEKKIKAGKINFGCVLKNEEDLSDFDSDELLDFCEGEDEDETFDFYPEKD